MRPCPHISSFLLATSLLIVTSLRANPGPPQEATDYASHFNHGGQLFQQMRIRDAVVEFREAIRLEPSYLPAHQALAVGYAMSQRFDLAWQEVALVRHAKGDLPPAFLRTLGEELPEKDAAAKREANSAELAAAQKAVDSAPKDTAAIARLSRAFLNLGDFPAAQKQADLALQLNPKEPMAQFVLATLLALDPPTFQEALPHLKLYLQNAPRDASTSADVAQACWMLGDLYRRSEKEAPALAAYEDGLKVEPENFHILNNAAWLYATASDASLRDPKKALAYAQKAVALTNSAKSTLLDTLGESYYVNGRYDDAIATEKKAIALSPENDLYADQLKKFQKAKQSQDAPKP